MFFNKKRTDFICTNKELKTILCLLQSGKNYLEQSRKEECLSDLNVAIKIIKIILKEED